MGRLPRTAFRPLTRVTPTCRIPYMSTKTIAVNSRVYDRLAAIRREGESFSKTIDRLLVVDGSAHTGSDILRGLGEVPALSEEDPETFLEVAAENRAGEEWNASDLR